MSLLDKVFVAGWIIRKHIGWKHIALATPTIATISTPSCSAVRKLPPTSAQPEIGIEPKDADCYKQ